MGMDSPKQKRSAASRKASGIKKHPSRAQRYRRSQGNDPVLTKNKHGRIVSRSRSNRGEKSAWIKAVQQARKELGVVGFQVVGGNTAIGKKLYERAKKLHGKAGRGDEA